VFSEKDKEDVFITDVDEFLKEFHYKEAEKSLLLQSDSRNRNDLKLMHLGKEEDSDVIKQN